MGDKGRKVFFIIIGILLVAIVCMTIYAVISKNENDKEEQRQIETDLEYMRTSFIETDVPEEEETSISTYTETNTTSNDETTIVSSDSIVGIKSEIIKENNSFDYTKYTTIKEFTLDFEDYLIGKQLRILGISFVTAEESKDVIYNKKVTFKLSSEIDIVMYFDANQLFIKMDVEYIDLNKNNDESQYNKLRTIPLGWDYFSLTDEEIELVQELSKSKISLEYFTFEDIRHEYDTGESTIRQLVITNNKNTTH